ncbi:MAG TPA: NAD(P)H-dependent oxidoreductase, partial [Saprospiraceae bacterium]|nr:NAD(P)H-dependent oxidoreductase [Saprospiraceae bacterium]
ANSFESQLNVRDLYELYPDFDIDIKEEQKQLLEADIVILQHPLYWYSCPPLMKQWMDLVLEYGWAYGKNGTFLQGKRILQVISTGGGLEMYTLEGRHGHTIREFLLPFEQSAILCNMEYLPPLVVPKANVITDQDTLHFKDLYQYFLEKMIHNDLDFVKCKKIDYLNDLTK